MLTPDQINTIHRLHGVEKWSLRKIAAHLHIGRRTLAKYVEDPAPAPTRRDRSSKLDAFKHAIAELLEQDPAAHAPVIAQRLRTLGYDGGETILKDYLRALRAESKRRRAYVRVELSPGERFDIDWGHFGSLLCAGSSRKLYAFCLVESHSRKMYLEFTHRQSFETFRALSYSRLRRVRWLRARTLVRQSGYRGRRARREPGALQSTLPCLRP